jgi:hypothetical protein
MQNINLSPSEIRRAGWEALRTRLGIAGSLKFILEYSGGEGNYTKMRREYFKNLTVKDILHDMRSGGFIDNI